MNREETREQLKNSLKQYVERITNHSKGTNMYICPLCGSGTGKSHTGAFSITADGTRWTCFSCEKQGDIFDLIGEIESLPDYNAQLQRAAEIFNISIESGGYNSRSTAAKDFREYQNQPKNERKAHTDSDTHKGAYTAEYTHKQPPTFTDFYTAAHNNLDKTDYPQRRGLLNRQLLDRFNIGYIENWKHPKSRADTPASPRLIIPITAYNYTARDTRAELTPEQERYKKQKAKSADNISVSWIFNAKALQEATAPIFVTEGELDALSIMEAGGEAIATGSTANTRALLKMLERDAPRQPLIIAMDNDSAGDKAATDLIEGIDQQKGLKALGISFYRLNPYGDAKDANEALTRDRDAFFDAIAEALDNVDSAEKQELEAEREEYKRSSTAAHLQEFINGIADSANTPATPTGFKKLDTALDGGLYEGLYIIGAITSLGKTTFIMQIADQIAQSGEDVLIFSLEMARNELISKSLSRHTLIETLESGGDMRNAKTARGITTGDRYPFYNDTERELINNAIQTYSQYATNIYVSEGLGNIGAEQIRETVKKHISLTNKKPIVIIDYLQILAPYSERATDKQNTDKAVMELKRISRDYKIPVIGISSFNRQNYKEAVTMEAFKESGAIEYSSDLLIGLQLKGAGKKDFDPSEAKRKNPREIELVILKNRNGRTGDKITYSYYPLFNYFKEE